MCHRCVTCGYYSLSFRPIFNRRVKPDHFILYLNLKRWDTAAGTDGRETISSHTLGPLVSIYSSRMVYCMWQRLKINYSAQSLLSFNKSVVNEINTSVYLVLDDFAIAGLHPFFNRKKMHLYMFCWFLSRIGSSSSTEPLTACQGSLGRSSVAGCSRHRPNFFSQLSGQTFYNNEYGHLSEEGFCDFFSSPDTPCLASSNV